MILSLGPLLLSVVKLCLVQLILVSPLPLEEAALKKRMLEV